MFVVYIKSSTRLPKGKLNKFSIVLVLLGFSVTLTIVSFNTLVGLVSIEDIKVVSLIAHKPLLKLILIVRLKVDENGFNVMLN